MIAAQTHDEGQRRWGSSLFIILIFLPEGGKTFQHSAGFGSDLQIPPPHLSGVPDDA